MPPFAPAIRCVVFDLDGLLIDSEPLFEEAARRLLAVRGKELIADVMRKMMGAPAHAVKRVIRGKAGKVARRVSVGSLLVTAPVRL